MKRITLLAIVLLLAGSVPAYAADQVEPVGLRVDVPEAVPTEAEDAAAAVAAEMVQSILDGADEGAAWDELATVLEERSMVPGSLGSTDGMTSAESGWSATLSSEWARFKSTLRGETAWTLETERWTGQLPPTKACGPAPSSCGASSSTRRSGNRPVT